jgi:uncharacterized membrane protein
MNNPIAHKRLLLPDILKGIAILFMIQVHIMELLAHQDVFNSSWGKISLFLGGAPAAPLFMIIMGYFIAWKNASPSDQIKRGVQLFFYGILLNIGLNLHLIYRVLADGWNYNLYEYLFGVDILHFAGLALIITGLLPKWIKSNQWLLISLILLVFILQSSISANSSNCCIYITSYIIGGTQWSYFPFIPWLVYPLTGILFFQFEQQNPQVIQSKPNTTGLLIALGLFITLSWEFASSINYNLPQYYHHGFDYFIWAILFLGLSTLLISAIYKPYYHSKWSKYLIFTGRNITNIYIIQWLIIGNLATGYYQQFNGKQVVISFIVITILSSLLSYLYQKIKKRFV